MTNFLIGFFSIALIILSLFIILMVLMQRASSNAGMGSSLGGGAVEGALGAESSNILNRWTIYAAVAFFVITFGLYLGYMQKEGGKQQATSTLPEITLPAADTEETHVPGSLTEIPLDKAKE